MLQGTHIAVVIPARNEEDHIDRVLTTLPVCVDSVVVVDDGSTNQTGQRAKMAESPCPVEIVRLAGEGVGAAIDQPRGERGRGEQRGEGRRHEEECKEAAGGDEQPHIRLEERRLGEALRGVTFYLLIPGFLATAFFDTALGFHLLAIAKLKNWSAEWVTAGYQIGRAHV